MNIPRNMLFLFIIIVLEGYIILSAELLAIRQTIPFVGSGTDTISIIIAAVLMPLAFGYHAGGQYTIKSATGKYRSIRKKLLTNIVIAACILLFGLTYFIMQFFFFGLETLGIDNKLLQITLFCGMFMVTPVYLLGQTIPLVSNYFGKEKLSQVTGRMLFFSTMGSFCGSLISTLVLMQYLGAHHTVTILFALLLTLTAILSTKRTRSLLITMMVITGLCAVLNSDGAMRILNIVKNNKYNTIMVMNDDTGAPHLFINNNDSSMYGENGQKHDYIELSERLTIEAIPHDAPPKDVLIIGAGGFTFGHDDAKNNFVYIDIDKDLKNVSEQYLLKNKLKPNKIFYPLPARAYLNKTDKKFDVILLDAYLGGLSIPEHLVTQEFFMEIQDHLNEGGVLVANFILSPNFNNQFSKNIDNTIRSVFPYISRHNALNDMNIWTESKTENANFIYIYKNNTDTAE